METFATGSKEKALFCKNCPNIPATPVNNKNNAVETFGICQASGFSKISIPKGDPIEQKKLTERTIMKGLTPLVPSFLNKKKNKENKN